VYSEDRCVGERSRGRTRTHNLRRAGAARPHLLIVGCDLSLTSSEKGKKTASIARLSLIKNGSLMSRYAMSAPRCHLLQEGHNSITKKFLSML